MAHLRTRTLLPGACLAAFCAIALAWVRLPGPYYDEMLFVPAALPDPVGGHVAANLRLFHRDIPSMLSPYVGALKGWLWRGVFAVWPPSIYSARIPVVLLAGLALLLFYLWARKCYSERTSILALGLVSIDPSYIFTARLDWGPVVLSHVLLFAGLLLGTIWYQCTMVKAGHSTARQFALVGGMGFCFGLGLWDKATFIWFLAALVTSLLVLFPRPCVHSLRPAACSVFTVCFLAGALPLLIYNFQTGRSGTATMVNIEPWNPNELVIKLDNIKSSLVGESVYYLVTMGPEPESYERNAGIAGNALNAAASVGSPFGEAFFWVFCLSVVALPFMARGHAEILFPFLMTGLMWAQMIIAKGAGVSVHHYVLAYPFPQLGVAVVAVRVWESSKRWRKAAMVTVLAVVLIGELSWDARYLRMFRETGGHKLWTDAIYDIAAYIEAQQLSQLAIMDWGFYTQLLLLTRGKVPMHEDWFAADVPRLANLVHDPKALFLLHTKDMDPFPGGQKLLEEIAPQHGATCRTARSFFDREGHLVALLVNCSSINKAGPSGNG